jgi:protein gp37
MSIGKSNIPYLTHVWNPVVGCTRGCDYCWARKLAKRTGRIIDCDLCAAFTPHVHPERLAVPGGKPKLIGLGFMTDLFAGDTWQWPQGATIPAAALPVGRSIFHTPIAAHPEHVFVTATKCPEGIPEGFEPPDNWWLLVTCCNQADVEARLPVALDRWPGRRVVLNLEPLMRRVVLPGSCVVDGYECGQDGIAGVILGGMSGPKAKYYHLMHDAVRVVRDACADAGVPFYFKQWSGYRPESLPLLDGVRHDALPWANCSTISKGSA